MKFSTLVILAAAWQQAQAQNVIADGAIDGFSNGVISAHNSQIDDAQAKSEVDQLIRYIASNPLVYNILDQAGSSVLNGFDEDSFPAFVTAVISSADAYESSPDFTTARSLISEYLPHYDVQQAISNVQSLNTLYWGLLTDNVKSFTTDAGVESAVIAGSSRVSQLFFDLGIFNTPTGASSAASSTSAAATSSSEAVVSSTTSSAAVSSSSAVSSATSSASSSAAVSSTPVTSSTPFTSSPFTSSFQGNLSTTGESSQAQPSSQTETNLFTSTLTGDVTTVSSVESITSTVVQTITHCDEDKCITPTISLTTVVPTNPATTTIETVVEGVTVTITVPCDTTAAPGPTPVSTQIISYQPTTIVVGTNSLVVTPEPNTVVVYPSTQGHDGFSSQVGPQPTDNGNVITTVGPQPTGGANVNADGTTYITQEVTRTLTHCDGWFGWNCVTPTVTLTTVVPSNHISAEIQAVISGNTYSLTVPYDTNTAPRAPAPEPTANNAPVAPEPTNGGNGGSVLANAGSETSSNPRNGIQQANGASTVGFSVAAAVAGAMVFLL